MTENERTRIAVLGTLAEFHNEAIPFDMSGLLALVASINPDLLCLDITPEQWRERDFAKLPSEYKEVLLPLASQTDIVVAPIGSKMSPPNKVLDGWRIVVINWLRGWIESIARQAPGPTATSLGWRHDLINYLYDAIRWLSGSDVKREARVHTDGMTREVLALSRRDPGTRVLVVVNVQFCHLIRERLRRYKELRITTYSDL